MALVSGRDWRAPLLVARFGGFLRLWRRLRVWIRIRQRRMGATGALRSVSSLVGPWILWGWFCEPCVGDEYQRLQYLPQRASVEWRLGRHGRGLPWRAVRRDRSRDGGADPVRRFGARTNADRSECGQPSFRGERNGLPAGLC